MKSSNRAMSKFIFFCAATCFALFATSEERDRLRTFQRDTYTSYLEHAGGVHADVISCIDAEIYKRNKEIDGQLAAAKRDTSNAELWVALRNSQNTWAKYISSKCEVYRELGGQRAELLTRNCILDEVLSQNFFVRTFLAEAQL